MRGPGSRLRVVVGSVVLLAAPAAAAAGLLSPAVRGPAARTMHTLAQAFAPAGPGDLRVAVTTTRGVFVGTPAYLLDEHGDARPVAHVVATQDGAVLLRFAPGEDASGPWRALVLPPGRGLREAFALAVTDEDARALARDLTSRLDGVFRECILPDARRRLPDFLRRIDPAHDGLSATTMQALATEMSDRLRPLWEDLASSVAKGVEREYGLLERLGIVWKMVRGDAEGLKRALAPVAEREARAWWDRRRGDVLAAVGDAIRARGPELEAWLRERVLAAARDELARPILSDHAARLEEEASAWLREAVDRIVEAPAGGFRVRFATVLRHHLLDKEQALLLLERGS
jgi:hypothetical protein